MAIKTKKLKAMNTLLKGFNQKGLEFIKELANELETPEDLTYATGILSAVLRVIRERITMEGAMNFISTLPADVKDMMVNGWDFEDGENKLHSKEAFIEAVKHNNFTEGKEFTDDLILEKDIKSVIRVLIHHMPAGAVDNLRAQLPPELAELWESDLAEISEADHLTDKPFSDGQTM